MQPDREVRPQIQRPRSSHDSISFQPTHDACKDLETMLVKEGFDAAAHPPLNQNTCREFGTPEDPGPARRAQRAGLDVTEALCPECPFRHNCDYQKRRKKAER